MILRIKCDVVNKLLTGELTEEIKQIPSVSNVVFDGAQVEITTEEELSPEKLAEFTAVYEKEI